MPTDQQQDRQAANNQRSSSALNSSSPTFTSNHHGQASLAGCPSRVSEGNRELCTGELEDVGVVGPLYEVLKDNDDTHHTSRISSSSLSPARRKPKYGDRAKTVDACSVGMFVFNDTTGLVKYNHNWRSESATMTRRGGCRAKAEKRVELLASSS